MNWLFIQGLLRHLLTFGGGFLVSDGVIDAEQADIITGSVLSLGGVIWSIFDKKGR